MKNDKILFIFFSLLILSCNSDYNEIEPGFNLNNYSYSVGTEDICEDDIRINCPAGETCDDSFDYRGYLYANEQFEFYIYFDPEIINNFSRDNIEEYLQHIDFILRFPGQRTENRAYFISNDKPINEFGVDNGEGIIVNFDDYQDGNLKLTISGETDVIKSFRISEDADCFIDDVAGLCRDDIEKNLNYIIKLNFCVE